MQLSGKTILVTGASGFIGSHLCRHLGTLGNEVIGVSRNVQPKTDFCSHWIQADLKEMDAVKKGIRAIRPNVIFHLASHVVGARDLERVMPTFQDNLASTVNLLIEATQCNCERIVLVGSLEEPEQSDGFVIPSSPYAAAKFAATAYGRMFHALYQTPVAIARLFMVYGPGQNDLTKLIPYVILSLLKNEIPSLSSGQRQVDWIYVEDVVEGLMTLACTPQIEGKTIDLGSGVAESIQETVFRLVRILNSGIQPNFGRIPDRPMEQIRIANTTDAFAQTKWMPETSLEQGLRRTIDWYRTHFGPS